jgi:hypothetical protein
VLAAGGGVHSGGASTTQRALVATAKVVNLDGSMAQFLSPVTTHDVLGGDDRPRFLCDSDELRFDALRPYNLTVFEPRHYYSTNYATAITILQMFEIRHYVLLEMI